MTIITAAVAATQASFTYYPGMVSTYPSNVAVNEPKKRKQHGPPNRRQHWNKS